MSATIINLASFEVRAMICYVTTKEKIRDFRWKLFVQPPYGPDLAPGNYFFSHFKRWLARRLFESHCYESVQFLSGVLSCTGVEDAGAVFRNVFRSELRLCGRTK